MGKCNTYENENFYLIKDLIESHGYKMTYQRREILMEFIKNSQRHLTAEDIYNKLKHKGIGISTVYRNIKIFTELKILKEFKVDDVNYYELKMYARKPLHIHFQCENCDSVEDILDQEIILKYLKINNLIQKKYDIEIFDVDIMFHGLCKKCSK